MTNTAIITDFIDYETLRLITGWSESNIKVMKSRSKFSTVKYIDSGRGGKSGKKPVISLADPAIPPQARIKYLELKGIKPSVEAISEKEADAVLYAKAPEYNRKRADKYLTLIQATTGISGKAKLNQFINEIWNVKYPDWKTSYVRLMEAKKAYETAGISGLLGGYGKTIGSTSIKEEWFNHFFSLYMKEGGPSVKSCWMITLGHFHLLDNSITAENFPHPNTFIRLLESRTSEAAICLAREGNDAHNRKYAKYIERDASNIICNDIWVTDHAQIDVAVFRPDGKPCFPWLTAFSDFKSNKFLGWNIHWEDPNSDHIFLAFKSAADGYGLPRHIYMDNGKDFRCKDFAGGRRVVKVKVNENSKQVSTLRMLNIEPHFSLPYNGQTKPIERNFNTNKEYFSKHMVGYRGGDVTERPEILQHEIKSGQIFQFEEFVELMNSYIENVLNVMPSEGKDLGGLSRNQLFESEVTEIRKVRSDALMLFCMRTTGTLTIMRNGVLDSQIGSRYWAEWMSGVKGKKVYLRRDINRFQEAWVFDAETEEFIGQATLAESAAVLATTDIERTTLRRLTAQKKQDLKAQQAYLNNITQISSSDKILQAATGAKLLADKNKSSVKHSKKVIRLANTKMDDITHHAAEMKRTGTDDLSAFLSKETPQKKQPVFEFEYERIAWEKINGGK